MRTLKVLGILVSMGFAALPAVYSAMSIQPFGRRPKVAETTTANLASDDSATPRGTLH